MQQHQSIRDYLGHALAEQTLYAPGAQGRAQLIRDTGLDRQIIDIALIHGVVETAEFVLICQALDLDAADLIREAIANISGGLLADLDETPDQPQPEQYPS